MVPGGSKSVFWLLVRMVKAPQQPHHMLYNTIHFNSDIFGWLSRVCVCVHARGEWRDVWWAVERELLFVLYALPTLCAMRTISMMMRKWSNCFMFTTVRFVSCVSDIQVNGSRIIFHAVCRLRNKLHTASPSSSLSSLANVKSFFLTNSINCLG